MSGSGRRMGTGVPVTTPQELDERFRAAVGLAGPRPAIRTRRCGTGRADRRLGPGAVRRPARQPPPGPGRPLAAQLRRGVLHDRLVRPRGQRGRRGGGAPDRPGAAALPVGRRSTAPAPARSAAQDADPGRAARARRRRDRADRGRAAQGLRPPRAGHHPDHVDDRVAPAAGGRAGVRHRAGPATGRCPSASPGGGRRPAPPPAYPDDAIVVCSFGDASVNHAAAQAALNTAGWSTTPDRAAGAVRLRGQRHRHQRPLAEGWVAAVLRSRPGLRYRAADGCDLPATYDAAAEAADWVRASAGRPCCT